MITINEPISCPSPRSNEPIPEDCLVLNVYTKNVNNPKPVIVFIHSGGLYVGTGNSKHNGPEYLMEMDIVLVTFNYRLGFLGFASGRGGGHALGNAGFKDQNLVLKWIRKNIHHFGGDPDCVTLMGSSAGALSVALHLVSPMSVGLFHRAIIMSGGILPQWKFEMDQIQLAQKQAKLLGCIDDGNWFECLNRTSASVLASNVYSMFEFGRDNPIYVWLPVLEAENGDNSFLIRNPMELISHGDFQKVPILTGVTQDEIASSAYDLLVNEKLLTEWEQNFSTWAPIVLQYERGTNRSIEISNELWNFYFQNNSRSFEQMINVGC